MAALTPVLDSPEDVALAHSPIRKRITNAVTMRRLGWIVLGYQIGATALLGSLAGGSQAMKTELLENLLARFPSRFADRASHGKQRAGCFAALRLSSRGHDYLCCGGFYARRHRRLSVARFCCTTSRSTPAPK